MVTTWNSSLPFHFLKKIPALVSHSFVVSVWLRLWLLCSEPRQDIFYLTDEDTRLNPRLNVGSTPGTDRTTSFALVAFTPQILSLFWQICIHPLLFSLRISGLSPEVICTNDKLIKWCMKQRIQDHYCSLGLYSSPSRIIFLLLQRHFCKELHTLSFLGWLYTLLNQWLSDQTLVFLTSWNIYTDCRLSG